ncbi:MAG TPA: hypothetical protein VHO01_10065 [Jatrophihabitans sp.]|nr:hypothetical protein [Jatrophihabitans sp.]
MLARRSAELFVLLLTGWLLWPQRLAGYGLGHDMVFTPDQPLNAGSVGLGSTPPRAVPLDALVALAGKALGGEVTGRLALVIPLLAAGWGAQRLLAHLLPEPQSARLPALLLVGGAVVWNPFVIERLALGQWALLWCYGALPWLVVAVRRRSRAATVLALAAAAITPTGAVIAAAVLLVTGWRRRLRESLALTALAVLVQLPWLLPALTSGASATSDPRAVAAFAARAERPGGAVGSLLGLGGIWSADVTPASRAGVLGYLTALAVVLAVVAGRRLVPVRLWALAGAGFVLAALATMPGGGGALRWAVAHLPGAGLLRDGQKWLLPAVLIVIVAAGLALNRLRAQPVLLATLAAVLPLLLLPDGPATLRVPLSPVHYPAGWTQVARQVQGSRTVLVLPFSSYRSFAWAPGRTVLDPAPRLLDAPVLVDDRLAVGQELLRGEDPQVSAYLRHPDRLAGQGIGWVVVEQGTPGPVPTDLGQLTEVYAGPGVQLYRVPGPIAAPGSRAGRAVLVIGADLLVLLLVIVAAVQKAVQRAAALLHSPVTSAGES